MICSLRRDKVNALTPEKTQEQLDKAEAYLQKAASLLNPSAGPWIFGQKRPTELDAHLVVMILRLQDVGRDFIVPASLKEYAKEAYLEPCFQGVMGGRTTMYDGSGAMNK